MLIEGILHDKSISLLLMVSILILPVLAETDFMTKCFVAYFTRERSEIILLHCMFMFIIVGFQYIYYYIVKVDMSHLLPL